MLLTSSYDTNYGQIWKETSHSILKSQKKQTN